MQFQSLFDVLTIPLDLALYKFLWSRALHTTYLFQVIKNSALRVCWGRRNLYNSIPLPHQPSAAAPQQLPFSQSHTQNPQSYAPPNSLPTYPPPGFHPSQRFRPGLLPLSQSFPASPFPYVPQHVWMPSEGQYEATPQPYSRQARQSGLEQDGPPWQGLDPAIDQSSSEQYGQVPYSSTSLGRGSRPTLPPESRHRQTPSATFVRPFSFSYLYP